MQELIFITGGSSGLGLEAAKQLTSKGVKVIIASSNRERAENAIIDFERSDLVSYIHLNLEDRNSISNCVQEIKDYPLTGIILNSGVMSKQHQLSKNKLEIQFDINHLGHFFLISELYNSCQKLPQRVVIVSSLAHKSKYAQIRFNDINIQQEKYKMMKGYSQSKLANALFGQELARRINAQETKVILVHPGVSVTNLINGYPQWVCNLVKVLGPLYGTEKPKAAAKHLLYALENPNLKNGDFVGPQSKREWRGSSGIVKLSEQAQNEQLANDLWVFSEQLLDRKFGIVKR